MSDTGWQKLTVRLKTLQFLQLRDQAFQANLPMAVFARHLIAGDVPSKAPPSLHALETDCAQLLRCAYSLVTNSRQISQIAIELGEPYVQLTGESGVLGSIEQEARNLGLRIKQGAMAEATATEVLTEEALVAVEQFNSLAHELNSGRHVAGVEWHDAISAVRNFLAMATQPGGVTAHEL